MTRRTTRRTINFRYAVNMLLFSGSSPIVVSCGVRDHLSCNYQKYAQRKWHVMTLMTTKTTMMLLTTHQNECYTACIQNSMSTRITIPSSGACTLKLCDGLRASVTLRAMSIGVLYSWHAGPTKLNRSVG